MEKLMKLFKMLEIFFSILSMLISLSFSKSRLPNPKSAWCSLVESNERDVVWLSSVIRLLSAIAAT